jgi:trimeric autotransporter adhesin
VIRTGTGSGAVSGSAAGIACGATCSASLANGTIVTLTAVASPGSSFSGWSGACSGASSTCTFTLTSDRIATATFTADAALDVAGAGSGQGAVTGDGASGIDCGHTCDASFVNGATVTLTAVAAPGSTFAGWGGACGGTSATCTLVMTDDLTVTASFALNPVLSVLKAGTGNGSVSSSPVGIHCASACSEQQAAYAPGTTVTLTAIAADGSAFTGWSDGSCAGATTCTLSLDSARTVTATFTVNPPAPGLASDAGAGATPPVVAAAPVVPAPVAVQPKVAVAAVKARPLLRTRPKVAGSAGAGRTLVCTRGTWTGSPTRYVLTWRRDGRLVVGHGSAYRVRAADRGHTIRCEVSAVNAKGTTTVASAAVRVAR